MNNKPKNLWVMTLRNESGDDFGIVASWNHKPTLEEQREAAFKVSPSDCEPYSSPDGYCAPQSAADVDWENSYLMWQIQCIPEPQQ
jgi:hypothetical protein